MRLYRMYQQRPEGKSKGIGMKKAFCVFRIKNGVRFRALAIWDENDDVEHIPYKTRKQAVQIAWDHGIVKIRNLEEYHPSKGGK